MTVDALLIFNTLVTLVLGVWNWAARREIDRLSRNCDAYAAALASFPEGAEKFHEAGQGHRLGRDAGFIGFLRGAR